MPITATALLMFWDMACSLSVAPLAKFVPGGAGARPDHSISGSSVIRKLTQAQTRLDRSDGRITLRARGNSASALSRARISSGCGGVLPMMAGRIELLSAEHQGVNERNPRGIPYELGRLFNDTAGTTSETSINAVCHAHNEFALRHRLRGRAIACGC